MERPLFNDPLIMPDKSELEAVLGHLYSVYQRFIDIIELPPFGCTLQWNYYRDGGSWLCKIVKGKRTIVWLSVWDGYFKLGFYFAERQKEAIAATDEGKYLIDRYMASKPVGKLLPFAIKVDDELNVEDAVKLIILKFKIK